MKKTTDIASAAALLRGGGLVAFPTETVYGLGADAMNASAVRKIFKVKRRPADHPLIVHLAMGAPLEPWAAEFGPGARRLAARFWPGPLTIIVKKNPNVPSVVTGGQETIGLRTPAHPLALALLEAFGGGIAAPSANRFGRVSPTSADDVLAELNDGVDLVLDGGRSAVGIESTIVDLSDPTAPAVLRPGAVSIEALEETLGIRLPLRRGGPVRASGSHESHYAPRAEVLLTTERGAADAAADCRARGLRIGLIACGEVAGLPDDVVRLLVERNLEKLAHGLYAALRTADELGLASVLVVPPAEAGLGLALVDRLKKAAGTRRVDDGAENDKD